MNRKFILVIFFSLCGVLGIYVGLNNEFSDSFKGIMSLLCGLYILFVPELHIYEAFEKQRRIYRFIGSFVIIFSIMDLIS
jgi:hypothetical protein